jgi:hypothetical protein
MAKTVFAETFRLHFPGVNGVLTCGKRLKAPEDLTLEFLVRFGSDSDTLQMVAGHLVLMVAARAENKRKQELTCEKPHLSTGRNEQYLETALR